MVTGQGASHPGKGPMEGWKERGSLSTARAPPASQYCLAFLCPRKGRPRQGQAVLGYHTYMFKLWGKCIFPFSLPLPRIPEAGPGFGYQAAEALESTHPASWHESETADGSFSSAAIKQIPTGDWLAARRGNHSTGRITLRGGECACGCV